MHQVSKILFCHETTCFGHLCLSSGVISCTRGNWYVSCRLCGCCSGHITYMKHSNCHSVRLITPDDGHRRCPKHVVSWQNKILDIWCILLVIYTKKNSLHIRSEYSSLQTFTCCVYLRVSLCQCLSAFLGQDSDKTNGFLLRPQSEFIKRKQEHVR